MSRLLSALVLVLLCGQARADASVQGLDHVPVAVRDLDGAKADFETLGFVLKPGRPHGNGLRNMHAKFPDGTEIELITATAAADLLSSRYVEWLKSGDGPVALGLYRPGGVALRADGVDWVFFDHRQKSPTDRPEHFAHPNGAISLSGVWLAGSAAEQPMLNAGAGIAIERDACAPFGSSRRVLVFNEGEAGFLPQVLPRLPGRPIVGLTVTVRSLDEASRFASLKVAGCARKSLWVETHGMWLEFIER